MFVMVPLAHNNILIGTATQWNLILILILVMIVALILTPSSSLLLQSLPRRGNMCNYFR